jgi:hypothetical protein
MTAVDASPRARLPLSGVDAIDSNPIFTRR